MPCTVPIASRAYTRAQELFGGKSLVWILLLGLLVHIGYAFFYRIEPTVDARRYVETAWHLVQQRTYCLDCTVPLAADPAIHGVGPGYQFFLAALFLLVGKTYGLPWIAQSWISLAIAGYIAYRTRMKRSWVRTLLVGALVFHPDIVQSDAMLMTDTLFVGLAILVTEMTLWMSQNRVWKTDRQRWGMWLLIGGGYALTNLVRPTGLPMVVMAIAGLLLLRVSWKNLCALALGFLLIQSPWVIRNHQVYGRWMLNSAVGNINLWVGLHPNGDGRYDLARMPDVTEAATRLSAAEMEIYSGEQAKKLMSEHPVRSALRTVQKGFTLFSLTKTSGYWFHYKGRADQFMTATLSAASNTLLLVLGLWGLALGGIEAWRKRVLKPELVLRGGMVVACVVAPILTVVAYRYRLPLLPYCVVFGLDILDGNGLSIKRDRVMALALSVGVVGIGTLLDALVQWDKIVTRLSTML